MSEASSGRLSPHRIRSSFAADLDRVRLDVEVVSVLVGEALGRMATVLSTTDTAVAERALESDDAVDAMVVSLTERCYDLLRRQAPVASDLRFIVSALRVLEELERIGDLSLRVVKLSPELPSGSPIHRSILEMASAGRALYTLASRAWAEQNLELAATLADRDPVMDNHYAALLSQILALEGPGATALAVPAVLIGRALDRIADHSVIIGDRLSYMMTADSAHLASELR